MSGVSDARTWLRENGYGDVAAEIDAIMAKWRKRGSRTRRDWWQVLAGSRNGEARRVDGVLFPVLAAARRRSGLPPVETAVELRKGEHAPEVVPQARWAAPQKTGSPPRSQRKRAATVVTRHEKPSNGGSIARSHNTESNTRRPRATDQTPDTLVVSNFAQIEHAEIEFGDLTVLVGPQASGKSLLLQWLKVALDAGEVVSALKEAGHDVKSVENVLDLVFGEGMSAAWHESSSHVSFREQEIKPASWTKGLKKKLEGSVFYVPAHRALLLAEGWPAPFLKLNADTPVVARLFSQNLYKRFSGRQAAALFPVEGILKQQYRSLIDRAVFHGGSVELQKAGLRYRLQLTFKKDGVRLPFMTWTSGQREFTPLLLGLYHVLPSRKEKKREEVKWVVIEEPEMGLHPQGVTVVMLLVLDLLWRGYRVVISTHSPLVLDVVWAIQRLVESRARWQVLCQAFNVDASQQLQAVMKAATKHKYRVYYLHLDNRSQRVTARDISSLDPSSLNKAEAGWGGLTEFSSRFGEAVREAANESSDE